MDEKEALVQWIQQASGGSVGAVDSRLVGGTVPQGGKEEREEGDVNVCSHDLI